MDGLFNPNANVSPVTYDFSYDIISWLDKGPSNQLNKYFKKNNIQYKFGFTKEQLKARKDQFARYGKNINALSKIVVRVSNLEGEYRKVNVNSVTRDIYRNTMKDSFTRYAIAN